MPPIPNFNIDKPVKLVAKNNKQPKKIEIATWEIANPVEISLFKNGSEVEYDCIKDDVSKASEIHLKVVFSPILWAI